MEFHFTDPSFHAVDLSNWWSLFSFIAYLAARFISSIWAARDAAARGKSGPIIGLLVFFLAWPLGLLLWLAARPGTKVPPGAPVVRRLITRCTEPCCEAPVRKAGRILGASIYVCQAGHEFTVPAE